MSALFPIYIIVVAAGSGSRFGGDIPKQFRNLKGRPGYESDALTN